MTPDVAGRRDTQVTMHVTKTKGKRHGSFTLQIPEFIIVTPAHGEMCLLDHVWMWRELHEVLV